MLNSNPKYTYADITGDDVASSCVTLGGQIKWVVVEVDSRYLALDSCLIWFYSLLIIVANPTRLNTSRFQKY